MNKDEFLTWVDCVSEHMNALDRIIEDRRLLKTVMENHLKEFFDFDDIEFNRDMSVITLKISGDTHIRNEKLSELLMDWSIVIGYETCGIETVTIEVYPFGVPNDEGD